MEQKEDRGVSEVNKPHKEPTFPTEKLTQSGLAEHHYAETIFLL